MIYIESLTGWIIKLLSWTQNWCWRLADYFHFGSIGYWKPKRLFQFRFCRTRDILLGLEYRYSGLLIVKFQTDSGIFDIGIRKVAFDGVRSHSEFQNNLNVWLRILKTKHNISLIERINWMRLANKLTTKSFLVFLSWMLVVLQITLAR